MSHTKRFYRRDVTPQLARAVVELHALDDARAELLALLTVRARTAVSWSYFDGASWRRGVSNTYEQSLDDALGPGEP